MSVKCICMLHGCTLTMLLVQGCDREGYREVGKRRPGTSVGHPYSKQHQIGFLGTQLSPIPWCGLSGAFHSHFESPSNTPFWSSKPPWGIPHAYMALSCPHPAQTAELSRMAQKEYLSCNWDQPPLVHSLCTLEAANTGC